MGGKLGGGGVSLVRGLAARGDGLVHTLCFAAGAGWCTGYLDLPVVLRTVVGCSQSKQIGVMDP